MRNTDLNLFAPEDMLLTEHVYSVNIRPKKTSHPEAKTSFKHYQQLLMLLLISIALHAIIIWYVRPAVMPHIKPEFIPAINADLVWFQPKPAEPEVREAQKPEPIKQSQVENTQGETATAEVPSESTNADAKPEILTSDSNEKTIQAESSILGNTESFINNINRNMEQDMVDSATRNWKQNFYQDRINNPPDTQPQERATSDPIPWTEAQCDADGIHCTGAAQRVAKKVNCENTASKTLSILSGALGGSIQCTEVKGHDQYIDKRLKKDTN